MTAARELHAKTHNQQDAEYPRGHMPRGAAGRHPCECFTFHASCHTTALQIRVALGIRSLAGTAHCCASVEQHHGISMPCICKICAPAETMFEMKGGLQNQLADELRNKMQQQQVHCHTVRFGSTAKVLAECKPKIYRILECTTGSDLICQGQAAGTP